MLIDGHVVEAEKPTFVRTSTFTGGTTAQVGFPEADEYAQRYRFEDCTFDGNAFWLADDLTEIVDIQVRDTVNGAVAVHPAGRAGELRADWNAGVTPL